MTTETKTAARVAAERMARAGVSEMAVEFQDKHRKKSIRVFGDITARPGSILDIYDEEDNQEDAGDDPEGNL